MEDGEGGEIQTGVGGGEVAIGAAQVEDNGGDGLRWLQWEQRGEGADWRDHELSIRSEYETQLFLVILKARAGPFRWLPSEGGDEAGHVCACA